MKYLTKVSARNYELPVGQAERSERYLEHPHGPTVRTATYSEYLSELSEQKEGCEQFPNPRKMHRFSYFCCQFVAKMPQIDNGMIHLSVIFRHIKGGFFGEFKYCCHLCVVYLWQKCHK